MLRTYTCGPSAWPVTNNLLLWYEVHDAQLTALWARLCAVFYAPDVVSSPSNKANSMLELHEMTV